MPWQQQYLDRFYDRSRGWIDGTAEFHTMCAAAIPSGSTILEIGAGPSNQTSRFLSTLGEVYGLDVDLDAKSNDALTEFCVFDGKVFPYKDASFDACVSNYVLEHIDDAALHLTEVKRILKSGGVYVFRTPNIYHYVALISRLTPHWFHECVANRLRVIDKDSHDLYPTYYRLNSRSAVRRFAEACALEVSELRMIEKEPSYGMSSRVLFVMFLVYERLVNMSDLLSLARANIFCVLRKPSVQSIAP